VSEFNINGILDFVTKEQIHKFDNIITTKSNSSGSLNVDLGFSLSTLFGNWKTALLTILITIYLFILMILFLPSIIQTLIHKFLYLSFQNRKND